MGISPDCQQIEWRDLKTLATGERAMADEIMREQFLPATME